MLIHQGGVAQRLADALQHHIVRLGARPLHRHLGPAARVGAEERPKPVGGAACFAVALQAVRSSSYWQSECAHACAGQGTLGTLSSPLPRPHPLSPPHLLLKPSVRQKCSGALLKPILNILAAVAPLISRN